MVVKNISVLQTSLSIVVSFLLSFFILGCANSSQRTLYERLGSEAGVAELMNHFTVEIGSDPVLLDYFKGAGIARFKSQLGEFICMVSSGPCLYTGEDMLVVHSGMNITEADFNRLVDALINAMNRQGLAHSTQNQLLARLVPYRSKIMNH